MGALFNGIFYHSAFSDILPQLKHVGFLAFASLSPSFLTVWTVLQEPIAEFQGHSSPERCLSRDISVPFACIPVCMQSGYAIIPFLCIDCGLVAFPTSWRSPFGTIVSWGFSSTTSFESSFVPAFV